MSRFEGKRTTKIASKMTRMANTLALWRPARAPRRGWPPDTHPGSPFSSFRPRFEGGALYNAGGVLAERPCSGIVGKPAPRAAPNGPEHSRLFPTIPEHLRSAPFEKMEPRPAPNGIFGENSRMVRNGQEWSGMFRNVQEWSGMVRNVQEWSGMFGLEEYIGDKAVI